MALEQVILTINGLQLQTIYQGLDELPGKIGRPVFISIAEQVQRQIDADDAEKARVAAATKQALDKASKNEEQHPSE